MTPDELDALEWELASARGFLVTRAEDALVVETGAGWPDWIDPEQSLRAALNCPHRGALDYEMNDHGAWIIPFEVQS